MPVRHRSSVKRHSSNSSTDVQSVRRELRQERAARERAEAKVQTLEWKLEAMEQELQALRRSRSETEEMLQKEIRRLNRELADRDELLENLREQVQWFRDNFFANNRSERDGADDAAAEENGRALELDGTEVAGADAADTKASEKDEEETQSRGEQEKPKRPRGQQKGSKGPGRSDRSQLRKETEYLEKKGCACNTCGKAYRRLSATKRSRLIEIIFEFVDTYYERYVYVPACDCEGNKVVTADPPPKLYPRCEIGNSVWVHLIVQKFLNGTPTNRTLKEFSLHGFPLSQGTVTGGLKTINDRLDLLYQGIIDHCRGADFWNGDETWWNIYGKRWWMWLVASDDAVAYLLDPSRSKKVPTNFFAGSAGTFMTDRLASYKGLSNEIKKAWCWVHQRRDFRNVLRGIPKLKGWATDWLYRIATLFVLNHKVFKLWEENKSFGNSWEAACESLKQHVDKMKEQWESELKQPGLHKKQKTILGSMKRHWEGLTLFLADPRIPLDNNRAERLIRNAVILRKNCYGSGAQWAGELAAKVFSIFQTWLINGLDPEALLLDYFNECSKPGRPPPDTSLFLPWLMSEERKRLFKLPDSYRRPG